MKNILFFLAALLLPTLALAVQISVPSAPNQGYVLMSSPTGQYTTLISTSSPQFWLNGNRTDSYTADGGILRPYKTFSSWISGVPANTAGVELNMAPGTYIEGAPDTLFQVPFVIHGNESTLVEPSGITLPASFDIYDLAIIGAVHESDPALNFIHQFVNGLVSTGGALFQIDGNATINNEALGGNTILSISNGALSNIAGSISYGVINNFGLLNFNDDQIQSGTSTTYLINATTTEWLPGGIFGNVNILGATILATSTGGAVNISNGATSTTNNILGVAGVTLGASFTAGNAATVLCDAALYNPTTGALVLPTGTNWKPCVDENVQVLSNFAMSGSATSTFAGGIEANGIGSPWFVATSTTATSTFAGGIKITGGGFSISNFTGTKCLDEVNGVVFTTSSDCGSSSGLTAYDAWTHAISGYSATTTNLYPAGLQTGTSTIGTLTATSSITNQSVKSALVLNSATGLEGAYGGTTCTNQFVRSLNGAGAASCSTVANADLANATIVVNGTTLTLGDSADTITAASSTLLANSNKFSGLDLFTYSATTTHSGGVEANGVGSPWFSATSSTATSTFQGGLTTISLGLPNIVNKLLYTGNNGQVTGVATSSLGVTGPITFSGTIGSQVGGTGGNFACTNASAGVTGCLTGTDWSTFNNKDSFAWPFTSTTWGGIVANATTTNVQFTGTIAATSSVGNLTAGTVNATSSLIVPLTGVLKGNGSSAVTVASNGTDFSLISALSCTAGNHLATVSASGAFTCSADTGGGSLGYTAWGGSIATTYGTSTIASTTPAWFQTAFYASSTVANPSAIDNLVTTNATTSNAFTIGKYHFATSSADYLDVQNENNANYSLLRLIAPTTNHDESTFTSLINVDGVQNSNNIEFDDIYNEHYNNSVQTGFRQGYDGTGVAKPIVFGHWNHAMGTAGKDVGNQFLLMPNGTVAASVATSTVNTAAMLYVASSTAADPFMVDTTPGTTKLTVAANGNVTVGGGALIVNGNSQINGGNSLVLRNAAGNSDIFCFNNGASSANLLDCSDFTGSLPITFDGTLTLTHALTAANGGTGGTSLSNAFTLSSNVFSLFEHHSFTYATTTWSGTTTIPLEIGYGEIWNTIQCYTDTGTVNTQIGYGTASTTMFNASTTVGTVTYTTNNTMTAGNKVKVDLGTPASSPLKVTCSVQDRL